MTKSFKMLILVCFIMSSCLFSSQRFFESDKQFWLNIGLGTGYLPEGHSNKFTVSMNLTYKQGITLFSLRHIQFARLFSGDPPLWAWGLLCGLSKSYGPVHISAGVGVALVGGSINKVIKEYKGEEYTAYQRGTTIGIPFEVQVFLSISPHFGIGSYLFANINKKQNCLGATISLQYKF